MGHHPCCCGGESGECAVCNGPAPLQVEVALAGITNNVCSDCGVLNGSLIFELDGPGSLGAGCAWTYTPPEDYCWLHINGSDVKLRLHPQGFFGSFYRLDLILPGANGYWYHDYPNLNLVNCNEWDSFALDLSASAPGSFGCDISAATCAVSAV